MCCISMYTTTQSAHTHCDKVTPPHSHTCIWSKHNHHKRSWPPRWSPLRSCRTSRARTCRPNTPARSWRTRAWLRTKHTLTITISGCLQVEVCVILSCTICASWHMHIWICVSLSVCVSPFTASRYALRSLCSLLPSAWGWNIKKEAQNTKSNTASWVGTSVSLSRRKTAPKNPR